MSEKEYQDLIRAIDSLDERAIEDALVWQQENGDLIAGTDYRLPGWDNVG